MWENLMCSNLPHNVNDLEYKYIFSNKSLFLRLLKRIDRINIFNKLTEEDLELVDKNYVLPDFSEQESDLLYKARLQEEELFFYILFEHHCTCIDVSSSLIKINLKIKVLNFHQLCQ